MLSVQCLRAFKRFQRQSSPAMAGCGKDDGKDINSPHQSRPSSVMQEQEENNDGASSGISGSGSGEFAIIAQRTVANIRRLQDNVSGGYCGAQARHVHTCLSSQSRRTFVCSRRLLKIRKPYPCPLSGCIFPLLHPLPKPQCRPPLQAPPPGSLIPRTLTGNPTRARSGRGTRRCSTTR